MRKILLFSFIISCAFTNAQLIDTIRFHKDYDRLVDSVNCIYVKTYCEHYIKSGESQSKQNDSISYVKYIKPRLDKEVLSYDTLRLLLTSKGWTATANNILDPLIAKKQQLKNMDNLLSISNIQGANKEEIRSVLFPLEVKLRKGIIEKYSLKSNNLDMMSLIIAIVALAMSLIACGLLVFNILKKNKSHKTSYREEVNDSPINTLIERTGKLERQVNRLNGVDIAVKELVRDVEALKKNNNKSTDKKETFQEKQPVIPTQNAQQQFGNYILLKSISAGYLKENDGASAMFRAFNINGQEAQFEFYGDVDYAIENQDSIFTEEICNCSGPKYNAKKVESIKPGKIQLEGNGKWKVIVKTEVKFS